MRYPSRSSFDDVPRSAWYFPYFEAAARQGWVLGDGNCYDTGRSVCTARPGDGINRAEVAALLKRAFAVSYDRSAPVFTDNRDTNQWYFRPIQSAADHCVLQGDDNTNRVRPGSRMIRAEMVTIFHRASQRLFYLNDCAPGKVMPGIASLQFEDDSTVRIRFTEDVVGTSADNVSSYEVARTAGATPLDIDNVRILSDNRVELELGETLRNRAYTVTALDIETEEGSIFSDSEAEDFSDADVNEEITDVQVRNSSELRVTFSTDIRATAIEDLDRYTLRRSDGTDSIRIDDANREDARRVILFLDGNMDADTNYRLTVNNMQTTDNTSFTDSATFHSQVSTTEGEITEVEVRSDSRIYLHFNEALQASVAEEEGRYTVESADSMSVSNAFLVDEDTVELTLGRNMRTQESFRVEASGLRTRAGDVFTDSATFVYAPNSISFETTLGGTQENPPTVTTATGTGSFTLSKNGLSYDIYIYGMTGATITGAHFHRGGPNENGPIVQPFTIGSNNHRASGTWSDLTMEERSLLLDEDIYVNVHTQTYPDGEIRGQVLRD